MNNLLPKFYFSLLSIVLVLLITGCGGGNNPVPPPVPSATVSPLTPSPTTLPTSGPALTPTPTSAVTPAPTHTPAPTFKPTPTRTPAPIVLINENFNGMTTGAAPTGWAPSLSPGTSLTVENIPSASNKSMCLGDLSGTYNVSAYKTFSAQARKFVLKLKGMIPNSAQSPRYTIILSDDRTTYFAICISGTPSYREVYYYYTDSENTMHSGNCGFFSDNVWFSLEVTLDLEAAAADISVDGGTVRHCSLPVFSRVNTLELSSTTIGSGYGYFDDIVLTAY